MEKHMLLFFKKKILLLRWGVKATKSFNTSFRIKLKQDKILSKVSTCVKDNLVDESSLGIWGWTESGLRDYKRRFLYHAKYNEYIITARDCFVRVGSCSWWD